MNSLRRYLRDVVSISIWIIIIAALLALVKFTEAS